MAGVASGIRRVAWQAGPSEGAGHLVSVAGDAQGARTGSRSRDIGGFGLRDTQVPARGSYLSWSSRDERVGAPGQFRGARVVRTSRAGLRALKLRLPVSAGATVLNCGTGGA